MPRGLFRGHRLCRALRIHQPPCSDANILCDENVAKVLCPSFSLLPLFSCWSGSYLRKYSCGSAFFPSRWSYLSSFASCLDSGGAPRRCRRRSAFRLPLSSQFSVLDLHYWRLFHAFPFPHPLFFFVGFSSYSLGPHSFSPV